MNNIPTSCPFCKSAFNDKSFDSSIPKDVYQCSSCHRKVRISQTGDKSFTIKELWRHAGGGTCLGGGEAYPSDDTYVRGKQEITITCTSNRHFALPFQLDSLEELLSLSGISPESEQDIRRLLVG